MSKGASSPANHLECFTVFFKERRKKAAKRVINSEIVNSNNRPGVRMPDVWVSCVFMEIHGRRTGQISDSAFSVEISDQCKNDNSESSALYS